MHGTNARIGGDDGMHTPLKHRVAVVTGASRGIGRTIATSFAKAGANVAIHYREREAEAVQVAEICQAHGVSAVVIGGDLTNEDDVRRLFIESSQLGLPSILVNNAGISDYGLLMDLSLAQWRHVLDVNLTSMFLCVREAIPFFRYAKQSRIINIASIHGIEGAAMEAAYAASKGGVIALTKSLARELASIHVTVNAIAPGAIDTEMMQRFTPSEREDIISRTPVGRMGKPEDVAALALYLASDDASFITGQVISPNGGIVT